MDFVWIVMTIVIVFVILVICGRMCCSDSQPGAITTTTTRVTTIQNPMDGPPYPVNQTMMPQPTTDTTVTFGWNVPPQNLGPPAQQNPPSYDEATGMYARQSPYNPNYK